MKLYLQLIVLAATIYLPIVSAGGVQSSAISYGVPVTIETNNWIEITCVDGQTPATYTADGMIIVICE